MNLLAVRERFKQDQIGVYFLNALMVLRNQSGNQTGESARLGSGARAQAGCRDPGPAQVGVARNGSDSPETTF